MSTADISHISLKTLVANFLKWKRSRKDSAERLLPENLGEYNFNWLVKPPTEFSRTS